MDWKDIISGITSNNKDYELSFFDPITEDELSGINLKTGTTVSGDLLSVLKQTNGIVDRRFGEYIVYSSDMIIERHRLHLDFLKVVNTSPPYDYLFFADNGCGECFGFMVQEGQIISDQVGVFYPIDNEFRVVAPDFLTWMNEWYTGRLAT